MIFSGSLLARVLDGTKTQTRRPAGPTRYVAGRTYAVQPGRGKRAVGRIAALSVRVERLGEITEADARAEGFESRKDFLFGWRELYGPWFGEARLVQRIEFRLEDQA